MKKLIIIILAILAFNIAVFAEEPITDNNIVHTSEYYRQQITLIQKYSEKNFINAVAEGDTKLVELYLKSGLSPDTTEMKMPAIFIAMGAKQYKMLDLLLKNGANTENTALGLTPLMFAINRKDAKSAQIFIDNNADVNRGYKGISPLYCAISKKQFDIAEALVRAGAAVDDDTIVRAINSENENIKNLVLKRAVEHIDEQK